MLFSVSSLSTAQQEIVISGRGFDPLLNYSGVPDQVYEAWQGTVLLDVDTSDTNGNYELKISSDGVITSTNDGKEYNLSNNYPEPFYHVKYAESDEGIHWETTGDICVDYDEFTNAIAKNA